MSPSPSVATHDPILSHGRVDAPHYYPYQVELRHSLENGKDLNLSYRPPALVEAAQTRYVGAFKNGSVASSILTVVSTELVLHFSESNTSAPALAILSHLSFTFNLSAAFSGLLLSNKIGSLTEGLARRDAPEPQSGYLATGGRSLLGWYGLKKRWCLLMVHWAMCFLFGVGCLFAQVMVHASTSETTPVTIATACVLGFAALPLAFAFRLIIH